VFSVQFSVILRVVWNEIWVWYLVDPALPTRGQTVISSGTFTTAVRLCQVMSGFFGILEHEHRQK